MTYRRVIPRDFFNESSLLKCLGTLYIELDKLPRDVLDGAAFALEDALSFDIVQDPNSGSTYVENFPLMVRGQPYTLTRPLNARSTWPLYVESDYDADVCISVFDDDGKLSAEMLAFLKNEGQADD